jgi:hypothetical protein
MPLKVVHEGSDLADEPAERCCMCRARTRYWYEPKDVALCPSCAEVTAAKNVPSKETWCEQERHLTRRVV